MFFYPFLTITPMTDFNNIWFINAKIMPAVCPQIYNIYIASFKPFNNKFIDKHIQCSPFITLCLGSVGMVCVISELCNKRTILQRDFRKMTTTWSFSYNPFRKFHGKKIWELQHNHVIFMCYNEVCYKGTPL